MYDELDVACYWTSMQWQAGYIGVDMSDVVSEAPDMIHYNDISYPYLRLALMRLAEGRGQLTLKDE